MNAIEFQFVDLKEAHIKAFNQKFDMVVMPQIIQTAKGLGLSRIWAVNNSVYFEKGNENVYINEMNEEMRDLYRTLQKIIGSEFGPHEFDYNLD